MSYYKFNFSPGPKEAKPLYMREVPTAPDYRFVENYLALVPGAAHQTRPLGEAWRP